MYPIPLEFQWLLEVDLAMPVPISTKPVLGLCCFADLSRFTTFSFAGAFACAGACAFSFSPLLLLLLGSGGVRTRWSQNSER